MSENKFYDEVRQHDSYGAINLSRVSTGGIDLFGSSIKNESIIALRINEAEEVEMFGKVKHAKKGRLIEVYMSQNQFSELITTMNVSEGVPCTINWIREKGSIARPGRTNRREVTESTLKDTINNLVDRLEEIQKDVESLKSKQSVSKKDKDKLAFDLMVFRNHLESNIPFVEKVFKEVMDKVVTEAKAEVDATVVHAVQSFGLEELKNRKLLTE